MLFGIFVLASLSLPWPMSVREMAIFCLPRGTTLEASYLHSDLRYIERGTITVARALDGSVARLQSARALELPFLRNRSYRLHTVLEATFSARRLPSAEAWAPDCANACPQFAAFSKAGGNSVVAGYHVVNYLGEEDSASFSVALAPGLGCTVLKASILVRGAFGLPVEAGVWEATSVRRGQPDSILFNPPDGKDLVVW